MTVKKYTKNRSSAGKRSKQANPAEKSSSNLELDDLRDTAGQDGQAVEALSNLPNYEKERHFDGYSFSSLLEPVETEKPSQENWFRLGYLIHDVSRMRRNLFDSRMKPEGITRSQWWVLANLVRNGTSAGVRSSDLAKLLDVGKVTLGGLVERLEVAGYVYRRPDKKDKRAKMIFITDAGHALIARMKTITEELNKSICMGLTREQIEATEANLQMIKENLRDLTSKDDEE